MSKPERRHDSSRRICAIDPDPARVARRACGAAAMTPIMSLSGVSKRFVKPLDLAARIANLFGAHQQEIAVRAIDGVDLAINEGEVVGLVGESGCGKSTLGRIVAGIMPPSGGSIA